MKQFILPLLVAWLTAVPSSIRAQPAPAPDGQDEAVGNAKRQLEDAQRLLSEQERDRALKAQADEERARVVRDLEAAYRLKTGRAAKKEMLPYCGVSTVEVTPALASQLKLPPGMGLLVDFVEPRSPAEMAGVKQYDILMKFNDQLLSNSQQLRVLVRSKMMSDDVKFSIIRQGQPTSVNVELGQKETEVESEADAGPGVGGMGGTRVARDGAGMMMGLGTTTIAPGGGAMAMTNAGGQLLWRDAQNTLSLRIKDGQPDLLVAQDRAGNEIYNGPVTTEAQRRALPADLAQKLVQFELGNPMRAARDVAGTRVLTSTEKDTLMLVRFDKGKAVHAFAFSTADGKTLFDGPVATEAQRKALPAEVAQQLETLEKNQEAAGEFGVVGRN